ncbi:MAG: hypothetical protein J6A15_08100 [Clostridia bacterium]|nr:hypothetical protein [Clostridia bacterium]
MMKILEELRPEFEASLTKLLNKKVNITVCKGKLRGKKAITFIKIKEAN